MQGRAASAIETATDVSVGWLVALGTQVVVFPVIGLQATVAQRAALSIVFTAVSFVRGHLLRRLFVRPERQEGA